MHFAQRTAHDGKILSINIDQTAVDVAISGYNSLTGDFNIFHAETGAAVLDKGIQLDEAVLIQQQGNSFAGGQLSTLMLLGSTLFTSA